MAVARRRMRRQNSPKGDWVVGWAKLFGRRSTLAQNVVGRSGHGQFSKPQSNSQGDSRLPTRLVPCLAALCSHVSPDVTHSTTLLLSSCVPPSSRRAPRGLSLHREPSPPPPISIVKSNAAPCRKAQRCCCWVLYLLYTLIPLVCCIAEGSALAHWFVCVCTFALSQ